MIGSLVVINKNGQYGSSYEMYDNSICKIGSGIDCQVRFNTKKRSIQNYCILSIMNRMVKLRRLSSFPVLVNDIQLESSKILNNGDILKIGPKSFKWTTIPDTESNSVQNKNPSKYTKISKRSLIEKRRATTENIKKINQRSLRNSTSTYLSDWEETNENLQPSKDAAGSRRSLRNSNSGRLSTWKETSGSLAPSSEDTKMEQFTISESPLKTSSTETIESPNTMLRKKTPKRKSNASNFISEKVATKSTSRKVSKIPRITGQTKIKVEENESPRSARKAKNLFRSPRTFSTTTFAVKINASSASTSEFKEILSDLDNTEKSPELKIGTSTEFKENVKESEPNTFRRKTRKSVTEPSTPNLNKSAVHLDLKTSNTEPRLRTSPRKTPKQLVGISMNESTPDSVPVTTNVKTPDTSMNKPLLISGIKAIKSANKRSASLEKSLDHMMLAKRRNISNVMTFDVSNIDSQDSTNIEDPIIFPSSTSKLHSSSKSNENFTNLVPLDTKQNIDHINVSGIKELVRTPKDLRTSSKTPGSRKSVRNLSTSDNTQYILDSPEKKIVTKNISYSTPKTKLLADWSVVNLTMETPKNNTSFVQDKYVSETNTPKQSFVDSPKHNKSSVTRSSRAVSPKHILTVGDIFDEYSARTSKSPKLNLTLSEMFVSPKNATTTINRSSRSMHGTPDASINDQTFYKSLGRRSQTPKLNQTPSSNLKDSDKNMTKSFRDRSLRSTTGTPEHVSSSNQTIDISGDKIFEQNLIASSTICGSPNINTSNTGDRSLRSIIKTPKHISNVDQQLGHSSITLNKTHPSNFNDSAENNITNIKNRSLRSLSVTPGNITGQTVDKSSGRRSKTPKENLILSEKNNLTNVAGVKELLKTPGRKQKEIGPENDLRNVFGVKQLMRSPRRKQNDPENDLTNIAGVKQLLKTPGRKQKELEPENDLRNVFGVKQLMRSPRRKQNDPENDLTNVAGVKQLLKTPGRKQKELEPENDLRNVFGVKQLMRSPRRKQNDPENDLTNIAGVKDLLKTPGRKQKELESENDLRNVFGVKQLMRSPRRKQNDPENDLTNIAGVKDLLKTPGRKQKELEPENDLRNVFGVKQLMRSPRRKQNDPENDLTNVAGVKQLLKTPGRKQKELEPENDLRNVFGVKQLMRSPRRKQREPKNDLSDLRGVKRLMQPTNEPLNDLSDVDGIEQLMKSPALRSRTPSHSQTETNEQNTESKHSISLKHDTSLDDLFDKLTNNEESIFKLENSPHRHVSKTYERKVKSLPEKSYGIDNSLKTRNSLCFVEKNTNVVDKWVQEHKQYHGILTECSVNIDSVFIGEEPLQVERNTETRKKNLRNKKIEIIENNRNEEIKPRTRSQRKIVEAVVDSPSTRTRRPQRAANKKTTQENEVIENEMAEEYPESNQNKINIEEEPILITTRRRPRKVASKDNKKEEEAEEILSDQIVDVEPTQKTRKGRPKKGLNKKTNPQIEKIVDDSNVQKTTRGNTKTTNIVGQENEPVEIAPKTRVLRARRGQKVDDKETEEIVIINSEPEKNTRSLRVKRQRTTKETESPALKRTRQNNVKPDSPVVEEVVVVQRTTRTIRNIAKPVVFSETVEILEHTDLPQLDIESLGVKPKAGRKRKIKEDVVQKQKIVTFEESPGTVVKELKRSTEQATNEPVTTVRRSARTKK